MRRCVNMFVFIVCFSPLYLHYIFSLLSTATLLVFVSIMCVFSVISTFYNCFCSRARYQSIELIQEGLGVEINEVFSSFDELPVASGSIAQVYKATLRPEYSPSGIKENTREGKNN